MGEEEPMARETRETGTQEPGEQEVVVQKENGGCFLFSPIEKLCSFHPYCTKIFSISRMSPVMDQQ